jgi:uncharacterized membrane protein
VYYAASDAFTHGRMPYRDFVLLHPPGLMLVLTPFAALGRATTDLTGFVAGNLALVTLGAINAVLVFRVAQRMGLSRTASWLGGAFYAVWYGAVYAELSSRLEPLGSFAFLCGLLALTGGRPDRIRRDALLAGAAFGFAVSVKVWWIAPLVVTAVWLARTSGGARRVGALLAGVLGAIVVVDGPFFALAPSSMFHMVVLDQLGRNSIVGRPDRLVLMSTLTAHGPVAIVVAVVLVAVLATLCAAAWRVPSARLAVSCAVAQLGVLLASPSFFHFYLDYVAPSLALVVAAAAHRARERTRDRIAAGLAGALVGIAACITAVSALFRPIGFIEPFPTDELADALPHVNCVMTVTPMALIELDALSTDLARHCVQWVDATGRTYGVDASHGARYLNRRQNPKWQTDVQHYLLSGGAVVLVGNAGSLDAQTLDEIRENVLLTRDGNVSLYRVLPDRPTASRERER